MNFTPQYNNPLENYYNDGAYTYIHTSTIINSPQQFQYIYDYCKSYIPTWKPDVNSVKNRLAFNNNSMFEIIFYCNLILIIPLYITNYSELEFNLLKIKDWCIKYIQVENGKNETLINMIQYKIIIYSPSNIHQHIKYYVIQKNKKLLDTS